VDLGTSCLVGATRETCREFLEHFLGDAVRKVDQKAIDKVVNNSVIVAGIRTTAYRKTRTAPFRLGLDTQIVRSELDQSAVGGRY
jgi:hypothetical protein